jgi:hypothetical protein
MLFGMSGAWGSGSWGAGAWGGAADGDIIVVAATALRENVIRVEFSKVVYLTGLLEAADASVTDKWAVSADTSTKGLDDETARPVSVTTVTYSTEADGVVAADLGRFLNITLDRPMTAWPAVYVVSFVGIYAQDFGSSITGDIRIEATFKVIEPPRIDQARPVRDFAMPAVPAADGIEIDFGAFVVDDTGDYAYDEGVTSLRKRVIRRMITRKGAFAHLPDYGVSIPDYAKRLAVSSVLSQLAADAEAQISREPDVAKVKVTARVDPRIPNLVRFLVLVRPIMGSAVQFDVPFRQAA